MTAYKESGIKWLGKIPAHWEVMKLKFLAKNIIGGGTPNTSNKEYWSENDLDSYLWVSIEDISKSSFIVNTKRKITKKGIENSSAKIVPPYSILYSIYASLGKVAYSDKELTTNQAILSIELKDRFYYKYYFYFLQSITKSIMEMSLSTTQNNISLSILQDFFVLVPPLEEQRKIADFLDKKLEKIDYFIAKQTKFIELLKEQKQVLINQATTKGLDKSTELKDTHIPHLGKIPTHWEAVRLKNIAKFNRGLNITKENLKDDGVYCISYGEIHSKYPFIVNPKNHKLKCVENEYLNTNINSMLYKGDFIFADTSEDIEGSGNFTLYDGEDEAFAGYHTIIVRVDKNIFYPKFLAYEFDSRTYRNKIQSLVSGVKVFSITQTILRETEVWIPPLEEQEKIAKYLDDKCEKIDKAINNITKQISLIQEYKTSLIDTTTKGMLKELK